MSGDRHLIRELDIERAYGEQMNEAARAWMGRAQSSEASLDRNIEWAGMLFVAAGMLDQEIRVPLGMLEKPPTLIVHHHEDPKDGSIVYRLELSK